MPVVFTPIDANDMLMEADLDDVTYQVGLHWNQEASRWTLSVHDLDGEPLVSGLAVVADFPLLRQVRDVLLPEGEFVVDCPGDVIGRRAFVEGRAVLMYFTSDEIEDAS